MASQGLGLVRSKMNRVLGYQASIQSTYWSIMRGPLLQYGYRVIVVSHCEVLTTGAGSQWETFDDDRCQMALCLIWVKKRKCVLSFTLIDLAETPLEVSDFHHYWSYIGTHDLQSFANEMLPLAQVRKIVLKGIKGILLWILSFIQIFSACAPKHFRHPVWHFR
jgi:hypothetical protein